MQSNRPYSGVVLAPSGTALAMVRGIAFGFSERYRKDCPQRSVVLMQSSDRLTGSFCHSARLRPPIVDVMFPVWFQEDVVVFGGERPAGLLALVLARERVGAETAAIETIVFFSRSFFFFHRSSNILTGVEQHRHLHCASNGFAVTRSGFPTSRCSGLVNLTATQREITQSALLAPML